MSRAENKDKMLKILARSPIVEAACVKANVGRTTFYRWVREDHEYAKAVNAAMDEGREFISDAAESRLIQAIKDGSVPAITYWLKHNRTQYRNRVEVSGAIGFELTPEQEDLIVKGLALADKERTP